MGLFLGDVHAGSEVAICPPRVSLELNGAFEANDLQRWIYDEWKRELDDVVALRERFQPDTFWLGLNGDLTDGAHHLATNQEFVSIREDVHVQIATALLLDLEDHVGGFDSVVATRGTPAHVGKGAALEEWLLKDLANLHGWPVAKDEARGSFTHYWARYEVGGYLIDQRHHGRTGQRAHTRASYARLYAQDIEFEHLIDEARPPDIAVRSHKHTAHDSGRDPGRRTRLLQLPCLQAATEWVHSKSFEKMSDLGMFLLLIEEDDRWPYDRVFHLEHQVGGQRPDVFTI